MYAELGAGDLRQLFNHSLVLNHGRLTYLRTLERDVYLGFDLELQRPVEIERADFYFRPVDRHIGMVNTSFGCGYLSRRPARVFSIGLTSENTRVSTLSHVIEEEIKGFTIRGIVDAYRDDYPSIEDALKKAKEQASNCAFDKSFAIRYDGVVYYRKMRAVGFYRNGEIEFNKGFEFLKFRIGGSNGKNYQPV